MGTPGAPGDPHQSFVATTPNDDPARCTELTPGRNPNRQRVALRRLGLGSQPPQPCYSGLLPEAAGSAGKLKHAAPVASMRQTWLTLVRYDSAKRSSCLLKFKTVANGCSLFLVGLLSRKPLSPKHRSTFLPLQHTATLISSVDWG